MIEQSSAHLARLDQPFLDFYEAYAQYQLDAAAWDAKYAPPPAIMTAPVTATPGTAYGPAAPETTAATPGTPASGA